MQSLLPVSEKYIGEAVQSGSLRYPGIDQDGLKQEEHHRECQKQAVNDPSDTHFRSLLFHRNGALFLPAGLKPVLLFRLWQASP